MILLQVCFAHVNIFLLLRYNWTNIEKIRRKYSICMYSIYNIVLKKNKQKNSECFLFWYMYIKYIYTQIHIVCPYYPAKYKVMDWIIGVCQEKITTARLYWSHCQTYYEEYIDCDRSAKSKTIICLNYHFETYGVFLCIVSFCDVFAVLRMYFYPIASNIYATGKLDSSHPALQHNTTCYYNSPF